MRAILIGASDVAVMTAKMLIGRGHDVVIVDVDRERIDELADDLDASFVHGDAGRPALLREIGPSEDDVVIALTDDDPENMIASLVARTLGFGRAITRIEDIELETICEDLGLEETIVPSRTIASYLADMVEGLQVAQLRTVMRGDARFFSFHAGPDDAGAVRELELPERAAVMCLYRGEDDFELARPETEIAEGDEVVVLTHRAHLEELRRRWRPRLAGDSEGGGKEE